MQMVKRLRSPAALLCGFLFSTMMFCASRGATQGAFCVKPFSTIVSSLLFKDFLDRLCRYLVSPRSLRSCSCLTQCSSIEHPPGDLAGDGSISVHPSKQVLPPRTRSRRDTISQCRAGKTDPHKMKQYVMCMHRPNLSAFMSI